MAALRSTSEGWDPLLATLALLLLVQVWRIQELFPVLAVPGMPVAATLLGLLLLTLDRDPRRRLTVWNQAAGRAVLGILVLVTLSIPGSLYPGASLQFLLIDYLRTVVLALLVAASVRGMKDLRRLAWVQLTGVTLFCLVVLARSKVGADGRLKDIAYYDVNDLATLIVCTLPLAVELFRSSGLWGRLAISAAVACLMVVLGQTGSRGGFLGFLAVSAYLLLRFHGFSKTQRLTAVAVLALLLVVLANDRYFERMQTLLNPSTDYNWSGQSESGRMEVWKRGLGYMASHPVLGVGARAFGVAEGTLAPEVGERQQYGWGFKWSAAHNAYIEIGAELGVMGLILFVALFVSAFRALGRVQRDSPGELAHLAQALSGSFIGFAVTSVFLSQAYSAYFYTLLGMTLALVRLGSRRPILRVPASPLSGRLAAPKPLGDPFPRPAGPAEQPS